MKENCKDIDNDGVKMLCNAIIYQAVKDYKHYSNILHKNPNNEMAKYELKQLERFFLSQYFEMLSDMDGNNLLITLREKIINERKSNK